MFFEILRRSDHDTPDIAADTRRDVRRVREIANTKGDIYAFVHQIDEAIEHQQPDGDAGMFSEEAIEDGPQHFFPQNGRR